MEAVAFVWDVFVHLDVHLSALMQQYGVWVYALLFVIIFCETGLVVTPFLPGDSLLFAAGTIAAGSSNALNIHELFILLVLASTLGNGLNYLIGRLIGPKVFHSTQSWLLNKKHLNEAHA